MTEVVRPDPSLPERVVLYEADNLTHRTGTGIATYARNLVQAAQRIGYATDGLVGVKRSISSRDEQLSEILAFDGPGEDESESLYSAIMRQIRAVGGLRVTEVPQSGVVIGPVADSLRSFRRVFAATQLTETCISHFSIFGR